MKIASLCFVFAAAALLSSGLTGPAARITFADGTSRTVRIEGVGCTVSICSRTAIKGKDRSGSLVSTSLDSIRIIKDTTPLEGVFVLKDGTERRLSLEKDFRVLYLASGTGGSQRLDLATVKSVEFAGVK